MTIVVIPCYQGARTVGEVVLPEVAVMWLTASALLLAVGTLAIVVAGI